MLVFDTVRISFKGGTVSLFHREPVLSDDVVNSRDADGIYPSKYAFNYSPFNCSEADYIVGDDHIHKLPFLSCSSENSLRLPPPGGRLSVLQKQKYWWDALTVQNILQNGSTQ